MGCRYEIISKWNGYCDMPTNYMTNNIIKAIWYLIRIANKHLIIDFKIRRGYKECGVCKHRTICGKGEKWSEQEED